MIWYIAVVAILNLGLGYALAVLLGAGRGQIASVTGDTLASTEPGDVEG